MSTSDRIDAVLASVPLNKTAARVLSQRGEHYEPPAPRLNPTHSDLPLPIKKIAGLGGSAVKAASELIGRRFGRLTVMGIFDNPAPGKPKAAWVVRCSCGHYETRKRKALVAPAGSEHGEDRCSACWALVHIQWKYRQEGGRPIEDFVQ